MKELIEKLESIESDLELMPIDFNMPTSLNRLEIKDILTALKQSEWVKVEDGLPNDKEWYQVSNGKGVYSMPHTYRENEGWIDLDGMPSLARIKYYRLLDLTPPLPPTES